MYDDFGKHVVIYGAGFEAERFLCLKEKELDVEFFIDRIANRTFHGKQVFAIEEVQKLHKKKILVAANEKSYREISSILESKGLVEFYDFISIHYYDKQFAILYGNCHINVIAKYLDQQIEFSKKYFLRVFYVGAKEVPNENELKHCDVFIGQDIRTNNELGMPDMNSLVKKTRECNVITIPNLYGYKFFWPQVTERFDNIDNLHLGNDRIPEKDLNNLSYAARGPVRWMIGWHDKYIERALEKGIDIDEIIDNCLYKDVFQPEEIRSVFLEAINKLIEREKDCDVKISDYILENYRNEELFYDPAHPTNILLKEKTRRILNKLNIYDIEFDECEMKLDSSEIFIYGCVRKALGLNYNKRYIKHFEKRGTLWGRSISVEEYIRQYKLWYENN